MTGARLAGLASGPLTVRATNLAAPSVVRARARGAAARPAMGPEKARSEVASDVG